MVLYCHYQYKFNIVIKKTKKVAVLRPFVLLNFKFYNISIMAVTNDFIAKIKSIPAPIHSA